MDITHAAYPLPAVRQRFNQVVNEILSALAHAEEAGLRKEQAEVMLELPHDLYDRLKVMASEIRVNGRRISVTKYIEGVLTKHVLASGMKMPRR